MWRRFLGAVLAAWIGMSAQADDGSDIREVIDRQIKAFEGGDVETAFGFASPMIQGMFRTPDNFGRMVRDGYPMIWQPDAVSYLGLRDEGGRVVQRMGFRSLDGKLHLFDYEMVSGPTGWRINGVYPVEAPNASV